MRIAQIVTLVSPDGAYGGPVRVAVNQARALIDLGHTVTVFAGTRGFDDPPRFIEGVPFELFAAGQLLPGLGFAGTISPGLLRAVRARARDFDVWHVHLARDLVTLPAAWILRHANRRFVVQCHGMIDESRRPLARPLDGLLTRPTLRSASRVLTLTPREEYDLIRVNRESLEFSRIANGVPAASGMASTIGHPLEVLFLARLQSRKRPLHFVESAIEIATSSPDCIFSLVGPDEGEGLAVRERIGRSGMSSRVQWEGAIEPKATLERMRQASIYVLPSVDEPFPMSVLEALSLGIPVIITETCGLAPFIKEAQAGIVVDKSQDSLTSAIQRLLADEGLRQRMGSNALDLVQRTFSIESVANQLTEEYELAMTLA